MMLTDNNSSAIYNFEEKTDDRTIVGNKPSSPRTFFERIYGHLEKDNSGSLKNQENNTKNESVVTQLNKFCRSPSESSASTSPSSPTLDIEETEERTTCYGEAICTRGYDQRTYGYSAPQVQIPFSHQRVVGTPPLASLADRYGSFRPVFGFGQDTTHLPAGLSAFFARIATFPNAFINSKCTVEVIFHCQRVTIRDSIVQQNNNEGNVPWMIFQQYRQQIQLVLDHF
ncbi:homeobox protein rough-like [Topomyia yanbarensis]|uniref:homeobox protein rough-like n=1 Tax=Topomyia yanbarensis TaxID=2498891 RepID=UPI00273C4BCF|nr:homeobox protein rough-like [Topomyia yanbarensis]